jgi:predicted HTH domain antitoxin
MEITLNIPDEFAHLIGAAGDIERRALEALALDEFRQGHLSRAELRELLGFTTRGKLDAFLTAHGISGTYTAEDLERDCQDLDQLSPYPTNIAKFTRFLTAANSARCSLPRTSCAPSIRSFSCCRPCRQRARRS